MIRKTLPFLVLFLCMGQIAHLAAQSVADLYAQVSPAVVVIKVIESEPVLDGSGKTAATGGLGSGFLISAEGKVMTAAHVVQTADRVMVEFPDGQRIPADVVGSDPSADVALLMLVWAPENPTVASLGDSDRVRIGDEVFIIGAPYGLQHSLSAGYVSSIRIEDAEVGDLINRQFIQTDAAINQGNSGGPMFNRQGEVIGICSYILSESGGFQGLGFAATSNIAKALLLDQHPIWSGMDAGYITAPLTEILNVPQEGALLVNKVVLVSPAGLLGLEGGKYKIKIDGEEIIIGGDIILEINGIQTTTPENLQKIRQAVKNLSAGSSLSAKVLRAGRIQELQWKIE